MGERIDVEALQVSIDPLRYLGKVVEIVDRLNEFAIEHIGRTSAAFAGHRNYVCIMWDDQEIWNTEGTHLDDRDIPEDEGLEPSFEWCCKIIADDALELHRAFSQASREGSTE